MTALSGSGVRIRGDATGTPSWRRVDISLIAVTFMVTAFGLLMVYSATRGNGAVPNRSFLDRQMTFAVLGTGLMVVAMLVDYRRLRELIVPIYVLTIVVLGAVLVFGVKVSGARAWFRFGPFQLQPSEFGKIVVIVALAAFFTIDRSAPRAGKVFVALLIVGIPSALIMLQPDLGTVLVYVAITAASFVVSGVRGRHIALLSLVVVLATVGVLQSGLLDDYQVNRLTAFIDNKPSKENKGVFEQQANAQTAIGSGGFVGTGLFEGSQKAAQLVSQKQTDFIFTIVGEEFGFVGGVVLLGLYAFMVMRIWRIGTMAPDTFGLLICAGVLAMTVFQVFESVGMSTGIMPITGIPMPFFSYGGSSILASYLGIGLVESVHLRRFA